MERFARLLLAHRGPIAALALVVLAAAGLALRHLELDLSLDRVLVASEEQRARVAAFEELVPPRRFDSVAVLTYPAVIDRAALAELEEITAEAGERDGVAEARSLANTPVVPPGAALPIPVPFPRTVTDDRTVREEVARHPLLERRLLSSDGHAAPIMITFDGDREPAEVDVAIDAFVEWLRDRVPGDVDVRAIGGAVVERTMARSMTRDMSRTVLLELLASAILLPLLFRTARGTVLPLAVVLLAVVLSLGLLSACNVPISVLDLAIPGLVTIIGLCDAVHMVHRFEVELGATGDRLVAARRMVARVGVACLQTSVTTGLGFLSLLVSEHDAVRAFGWKASLSVALTFVTVIVVLPLALSFWPARRAVVPGLGVLARLRVGRPAAPFAIAGVVVLLSLVGASRVVVDSHWLEELPQDAPEVRDLREYERRFQGILWSEVQLEGALDDPDVLRALEEFQRRVVALDDVDGCESVTHWIAEVAGNPEPMDDRARAAGAAALRMAGEAFPTHVVDPTFRRGRILFRTGDIGTRRYLELADEIDARAAALPADVRAEVAGYMRMAHDSSRLVVTTMLQSFLLSLAGMTLLVMLAYRSVRLGLVSILPNVLPILVALGLNGWLGIPLRIGIVMLYALGLGLAVDDTIHLLTSYRQERDDRPDASPREWMDAALGHTGQALVVTSLVLAVGCLCYLPAEFRSMRDVGLLLNSVVVAALLADLFVLPHLVLRFASGRRRQKPTPSTSRKTTT